MTAHQVQFLLLDLALIIVCARAAGQLFRRLGQPPVLGEITAGILLGPTLFGQSVTDALFPADVRPLLAALANVGVALFMLGVGIDLNRDLLRGGQRVVTTLATTSMAVPFAAGTLVALYLAERHATEQRLGFVLFMGVAMSVTAFPVLARILADRGLNRTRLGGIALCGAAVADVLAWSMLAAVMAVVGRDGQEPWRLALLPVYVAVMLWAVRPALRHLEERGRFRDRGSALTVVLTGLLLSSVATEWLGLHFLFGAFLFGAVLPRGTGEHLRTTATQETRQVTLVLLLPAYFLLAGLKVDLSALDLGGFGELALVLVVAIVGKSASAFAAARLHGLGNRDSAVLATLMNTRGLTELIVLTVGVETGILDGGLYSMMVVMALVTTAMAGPVLNRLLRPGSEGTPPSPARAADAGEPLSERRVTEEAG
ncbi:cation:proton antiporter [Streptomyces sp. NPDC047725]|uniref:cation:proton antiporter n=1 Tax=Streptomyces sp. NPDC047725 TaxID=3365487 RepID=UPI003719A1B8